MIAEIFLIGALALPANYSGSPDVVTSYARKTAFHFLLHTFLKEYSDERERNHPIILLVDDSAFLVERLRASGLSFVWAMSPFSSVSQWQFVGDLYESPIRRESIFVGYLANPVRNWSDIIHMIQMVKMRGYMVLDLENHTEYDPWLRKYGWERLPFSANGYSIYRRGVRTSA